MLPAAHGPGLGSVVRSEMANPSFPPSPWLSLYIKMTLIQPHGLFVSRLFPQLLNLFICQSYRS